MPGRLLCISSTLEEVERNGDNCLESITRQFFSLFHSQQSRSEKAGIAEKEERAPQAVLWVQRDAGSPGYTYFKLIPLQQKGDSEVCGQGRGKTATAASLPRLVQERLPWRLWLAWRQPKSNRVLLSVWRVHGLPGCMAGTCAGDIKVA